MISNPSSPSIAAKYARWTLSFGLLFGLLLGNSRSCDAHAPDLFMEVLKCVPTSKIEHTVETKDAVDTARVDTDLSGPDYYSVAVGGLGRPAGSQKAHLLWYKITNPIPAPAKQITCIDVVRGEESDKLEIGSAEFFLNPAQRLANGPPSKVPHGLDLYKAHRVIGEAARKVQIDIAGESKSAKRVFGKPLFVCIPTDEWHHDEYTPATHRKNAFVVYEVDEQPVDSRFTLIDQFGLNQVTAKKSCWICVAATVSID